MPCKYTVLNDGRLVVEKWIGAISHAEVMAHGVEQLGLEEIKAGAVKLSDTREAWFPESMLQQLQELANLHQPMKFAKIALLIKNETWPQARALETEVDTYGTSVYTLNMLDTEKMLSSACHVAGGRPTPGEDRICPKLHSLEASSPDEQHLPVYILEE